MRSEPAAAATTLQSKLASIFIEITRHSHSWPFEKPVDKTQVPDYEDVIAEPVDLTMIKERLDSGTYYRTKDIFAADLQVGNRRGEGEEASKGNKS